MLKLITCLLSHLSDDGLARRLTQFDVPANAIPQPLVGRKAAVKLYKEHELDHWKST